MVSTFSPNIQLEEPARGDQVGVWDTPVNSNMTLVDSVVGGVVNIVLNNANVVLSPAQYQSKTIIFTSTLTGNVQITFPTSFKKSYEIWHRCTGSSAFTITLATTNPGGNFIAAKPGDPFDCINDGASISFKNMGMIGSYWDYAGSSMPNWVDACALRPYLNCNGTAFSAGNYPQLAAILGGTTLPDARGRTAYYLNEGTARLTAGGAGINGNAIFGTGGSDGLQLLANQVPSLTSVNGAQVITVASNAAQKNIPVTNGPVATAPTVTNGTAFAPYSGSGAQDWTSVPNLTGANSISVTYTNADQNRILSVTPGFVSGLRLIRAA